LKPRLVYLDSSAIVKRYVEEAGSEKVCELYDSTLAGELTLSFSVWNIGEVLGVLDKYRRRGWLGDGDYAAARTMFIGETVRLLKLRLLLFVPVHVRLLASAWELVEKHHIYKADALQIVSAKHANASEMYTGDEDLRRAAAAEGVRSIVLR
jgi:predicted nucleic acid-binding protein